MSELTIEEKKAKVKDLRPIDDVFFEVLAQTFPVLCPALPKKNLTIPNSLYLVKQLNTLKPQKEALIPCVPL